MNGWFEKECVLSVMYLVVEKVKVDSFQSASSAAHRKSEALTSCSVLSYDKVNFTRCSILFACLMLSGDL